MDVANRRIIRSRIILKRQVSSSVDAVPIPPLSPLLVMEGGELFEDFITAQVEPEVTGPKPCDLHQHIFKRQPSLVKTELAGTAAKLRDLAINFAKTKERQQLHELVSEVHADINIEELVYLLIRMINRSEHMEEGIVIVFFFCFDLIVKIAGSRAKPFMDIQKMCKDAIATALGPRIQERGGWDVSIQKAAGNTVITGILATGMVMIARLGLSTIFNM